MLGSIASMDTIYKIGGARIGYFNASYPFATLSGNSEALHLSCLGREYHFPRSSIMRLRRHRSLFSVGLRIEHTKIELPEFIVFWASVFFWTSGFKKLRCQWIRDCFEGLGFSSAKLRLWPPTEGRLDSSR